MTQGTIIPPAVDQDSIEYGHVYANYVKSVADTPGDPDADPDIVHVNGQVTFDSTFPGASARGSIRLPASPRAYGLIVTGDTFEIVNSKLVDHEGREGVRLIASVDGIPLSWQAVVTLQDSAGRTIYNKSYIIHHDLWDSSGELLHINLPDLIPTPSRLEPPEGAAVRAAERALEEIRALTGSNEQINLDIEGLKSEVVVLHGQTGDRLAAAEAARSGAEAARVEAETARTGAETARTGAETARTGAQTARTGAEAARDTANNHRAAAQTARTGAEGARDAADGSALAAGQSETAAAGSAQGARDARDAAEGHASSAAGSASDAAGSASDAAGSASDAAGSASAADGHADRAQTARTGAEDARAATEGYRDTALSHKNAAATSATASADRAADALAYRNTAGTHAETATTQAGIATTKATTATTQAGIATTKAGEASDSAADAQALHDDVAAAVAQFDVDFAADMALFTGIRDDINLVANTVAVNANRAEDAAQATEDALTVVRAHRWVPQGAWEYDLDYSAGDVVAHDGGSYYAQQDIPAGVEPPGGDWMVLGQGGITDAAELTGALTEYVDASGVSVRLGDYFPGLDPELQVVQLAAILGVLYQSMDSSVEASRVTGALTDQVNVDDAVFTAHFPEGSSLVSVMEGMSAGMHASLSLGQLLDEVEGKSDVDHTHDGADISGALTDQVDASEAIVGYYSAMDDATYPTALKYLGYRMLDDVGAVLDPALESKADAEHTHDGADITGALTDQVDAGEATVTSDFTSMGGPVIENNLSHWMQILYTSVAMDIPAAIDGKADEGHTHDGADITGALTGDVDASQALVTYQYWDPNTEEVGSETIPLGPAISSAVGIGGSLQLLADELESVADRVNAAPATWHWSGTTLPTSASQVHAQARVGDFIVAPNLTTDPGWHRITGV